MERTTTTKIAKPSELTAVERAAFVAFVEAGGEVDPLTLPNLVAGAVLLAQVFNDGQLVCSGAIKHPNPGYWTGTFTKAGVASRCTEFPAELGWIRTDPGHEGSGHARYVVNALLVASADTAIFATTKKPAMRHILATSGFERIGDPYPSRRDPALKIDLFVKT